MFSYEQPQLDGWSYGYVAPSSVDAGGISVDSSVGTREYDIPLPLTGVVESLGDLAVESSFDD